MKFKSEVQLEALNNATVDTDKFLVSDSSTVKYRTGAQLLSDLGVSGIYVPYTGATGNVDLGTHTLSSYNLIVNHTSGSGVAASITKGGNGEALTINKTSGSGNAMSVTGGLTSLVDLTLSSIANSTIDTDRFIVSDSGLIKYRTGAQVLLDIGGQAALTNPITGTGTLNYVSKFTSATTLGNSQIFDNGTSVGIGTASPSYKLDVSTSSGENYIRVNSALNQDCGYRFSENGVNKWLIYNVAASDALAIYDNTATSERMRITSAGNVGIGTTAPSTLLDVNGIITAIGGNSTQWNSKQEALVSGTNIKTLNGNSVLGSGDLSTKGIHTLVKPAVGETTSFLLYGQTIGNVVGQANRLIAVPYIPATTITCSSLYINISTAKAGSNARILIYSDDNGKPGTKIYESANLDCSTTGIKTATTTQTFNAGTIYWICSHSSSTQTFSSANQGALIPINVSGISVFTSYYITPTFGSAPTTFGTGTFIQLALPFIGIKI